MTTKAIRFQVTSGSHNFVITPTTASDPNAVLTEESGSIARTIDGKLWRNKGGSVWSSLDDQFTSTLSGTVPPSGGGTEKFLRADGTWATITPSAYLAISKVAISSTNFSTSGNIDWIGQPPATSNPRSAPISTVHNKTEGGFLLQSLDWNVAGTTAFSQVGSQTWTSTATDDELGTALNTTSVNGYFTNSAVITGFGFRCLVPAGPTRQFLRVYVQHFSSVVTCNAVLTDLSLPRVSTTNDSGASAAGTTVFVIEYNSTTASWLSCVVYVSTNRTNPNIKLAGISLGTA